MKCVLCRFDLSTSASVELFVNMQCITPMSDAGKSFMDGLDATTRKADLPWALPDAINSGSREMFAFTDQGGKFLRGPSCRPGQSSLRRMLSRCAFVPLGAIRPS
jgi:hypothetical protein